MADGVPDFKMRAARHRAEIGKDGTEALFAAGRTWDLAPLLREGGSLLFPHTTLAVCGHQIAAAVNACLNCGAKRVVALGVIHALSDELRAARKRAQAGGDMESEPLRGIQGPGLAGREDWRQEFSLDHFCFLWDAACMNRVEPAPELILRYPFLVGGRPETMPGIEELREIASNTVVVATADLFHHGIGYGESSATALSPEGGGLETARKEIQAGLALLEAGNYLGFEKHCAKTKSDARDTAQVLRLLRGPLRGRILDLVADDMTEPYSAPSPTWVAGALIALEPPAG